MKIDVTDGLLMVERLMQSGETDRAKKLLSKIELLNRDQVKKKNRSKRGK